MVTGSSKAWLGGFGEIAPFGLVSNGKTLIANAITDKGVATSSSDSFATMANNIGNLKTLRLDSIEEKYLETLPEELPLLTDRYTAHNKLYCSSSSIRTTNYTYSLKNEHSLYNDPLDAMTFRYDNPQTESFNPFVVNMVYNRISNSFNATLSTNKLSIGQYKDEAIYGTIAMVSLTWDKIAHRVDIILRMTLTVSYADFVTTSGNTKTEDVTIQLRNQAVLQVPQINQFTVVL